MGITTAITLYDTDFVEWTARTAELLRAGRMSSIWSGPLNSGAVHNRLSEIRQQRGTAAAALGHKAGVSRQTVYAMEVA